MELIIYSTKMTKQALSYKVVKKVASPHGMEVEVEIFKTKCSQECINYTQLQHVKSQMTLIYWEVKSLAN